MKRPGLWANIIAKKKRGESPAKPGEKEYPTKKSWEKVTSLGYGGKLKVVKKTKPNK